MLLEIEASSSSSPWRRDEVRIAVESGCRRTRPLIAAKRLSVDGRGRVVYQYKLPLSDGSTHVVLEPLDFIPRLAALVPRPRLNLTRFHSAGGSERTPDARRQQ